MADTVLYYAPRLSMVRLAQSVGIALAMAFFPVMAADQISGLQIASAVTAGLIVWWQGGRPALEVTERAIVVRPMPVLFSETIPLERVDQARAVGSHLHLTMTGPSGRRTTLFVPHIENAREAAEAIDLIRRHGADARAIAMGASAATGNDLDITT